MEDVANPEIAIILANLESLGAIKDWINEFRPSLKDMSLSFCWYRFHSKIGVSGGSRTHMAQHLVKTANPRSTSAVCLPFHHANSELINQSDSYVNTSNAHPSTSQTPAPVPASPDRPKPVASSHL